MTPSLPLEIESTLSNHPAPNLDSNSEKKASEDSQYKGDSAHINKVACLLQIERLYFVHTEHKSPAALKFEHSEMHISFSCDSKFMRLEM